MNIPAEELKKGNGYVIYDIGYRIVCYYEKYHEALKGVYAKEIKGFMCEFEENGAVPKFISKEDVLDRFLKKYKDALAIAIYDISGKQIIRKERNDVTSKINNSEVYREELIYDYGKIYFDEGYRLVSFKDTNYHIGEYSKTLEGFMQGLADFEPIIDESDIPEFKSIDDILERTLKLSPAIDNIALYKTDGTCVAEKER